MAPVAARGETARGPHGPVIAPRPMRAVAERALPYAPRGTTRRRGCGQSAPRRCTVLAPAAPAIGPPEGRCRFATPGLAGAWPAGHAGRFAAPPRRRADTPLFPAFLRVRRAAARPASQARARWLPRTVGHRATRLGNVSGRSAVAHEAACFGRGTPRATKLAGDRGRGRAERLDQPHGAGRRRRWPWRRLGPHRRRLGATGVVDAAVAAAIAGGPSRAGRLSAAGRVAGRAGRVSWPGGAGGSAAGRGGAAAATRPAIASRWCVSG